jgi:glycosyltransferase involved in cell wall biosynthesis
MPVTTMNPHSNAAMPEAESPMFSVIVPCFNQGRFLREAVQSVQAQTHADWECLVIDDGSRDNSGQIARELAQSDTRIQLIEQENGGLSHARNRGLDASRGRFLQFLDADDTLAPDKLEAQLELLQSTHEMAACYSSYRLFFPAATDDLYREPMQSLKLDFDNPLRDLAARWENDLSIPVHAWLFDARLFETLRFDQNLRNHEDWDCWMQLFRAAPKIFFIDRPLATYRIHGTSLSRNHNRQRDGFLQSIRKQQQLFASNQEISRILTQKEAWVHHAYRDPGLARRTRDALQLQLMKLAPRPLKRAVKNAVKRLRK